MGIFIKDPATDKAVRELAKLKGLSLTEAIRVAVELETEKIKSETRRKDFLKAIEVIQLRVAARGRTGLVADKAFYDELSGNEDVL
jgi:antitoxin VapB